VNAYNRAVAAAAQLARAELELAVPEGARVRVDGLPFEGAASVALGQHFGVVTAEGYEPWTAVLPVSSAHERVTPPLRPYRPPDGDRLLALAGDPRARRLILGALERAPSGWRFVVRDVSLPDGRFVSDAATLGEAPLGATIGSLVQRLAPATAMPTATAVMTSPAPSRRRWWIWAVSGGGVALALAVAITLGVIYGASTSSGTIGGPLR
jgi:hypothetical protein